MNGKRMEKNYIRAPRSLRRRVARALADAKGPEEVQVLPAGDGTIVVSPKPVFLWKATLPNGIHVAFTTETPELEYSGLIDWFAEGMLRDRGEAAILEHSPECQELGVGCICQPKVVRRYRREAP